MGVYQTNPLPTSVNTPHGCQLLHCQSSTWEATEDGPGLLAPAPTWKAGKKQVPNLSSGYNSYLGNESMISRPALPLLLSVYKNLFFHIKKKKLKQIWRNIRIYDYGLQMDNTSFCTWTTHAACVCVLTAGLPYTCERCMKLGLVFPESFQTMPEQLLRD